MTNSRKIGDTGLSVPVIKPSTPPKRKKTPAEVAKWCAALPMADTGAAAKKLFMALDEITNTEMTAEERLPILELLRAPNRYICTSLKRHYIEQKNPLTEQQLIIANLRETLICYMSDNYKLIFEALHQKGARSSDGKTMLATSLVRILYYMNVRLICRYQLYMYPPNNIWHEIHLIYKYAKENDLLKINVKCEFLPSETVTSVLEAYTRIILLYATDPYQWRQKEQYSMSKAIELRALHSRIYEYSKIPNTKAGVYVIDLDKDEPPTLSDFIRNPINESCIALDLSEEVKHLKVILDKMRNNHLKAKIENPNDPEFSVTAPTISKLINIWSQHIVRSSERLPVKAEVSVAFGISAAYYYINDETEFNPTPNNLHTSFDNNNSPESEYIANLPVFEVSDESDEETTESNTTAEQPDGEGTIGAIDKELYKVYTYTTENISKDGFRTVVRDKTFPPLQAGEIIVFKNITDKATRWGIGAIRWMRRVSHEELYLGIEILSAYANAAGIQMLRGEKVSNRLVRCLVLPDNKDKNLPSRLITTSFPVDSNKVMLYLGNDEPIKATLTKEIDASGMYYLYEYSSEINVAVTKHDKNNDDNDSDTKKKKPNEDGDTKTNTEFDSIWGDL